jgi:FAD dependent oxidoreductase
VSATSALPHLAVATATVDLFRLPGQPLYVVGTLDTGVTVLSQQYRALNLVWGLVSSGRVRTDRNESPIESIAIVGGGFAGLSIAAGLTKKEANAKITIFERRDTLLPLQQGSDSRWLHPHIYDWPLEGSESSSAALPILNWTAARASDVVVQVLQGWKSLLSDRRYRYRTDQDGDRRLRIFCNTHHLQIGSARSAGGQAEIEWVGEPRDPINPANPLAGVWEPVGLTEKFDVVILTVGFGLERGRQTSYWRNETFAQPQLGQARMTYIVSGAGDGAMIDLFRLRIAQYRQDRILAELFAGHDRLLTRLRELDRQSRNGRGVKLFEQFDAVWLDGELAEQTRMVLSGLQHRLRHDTSVVLHVRQARFADLFDRGRVSFQNRLLAFLLFRVGGFQPSTDSLGRLCAEHRVPPERVIKRHGTDRKRVLQDILSTDLHPLLDAAFEDVDLLRQPDVLQWTGGFFDYPGPVPPSDADDAQRARWRKEYLPSPTQAIAAAFCSAIVGYLAHHHPRGSRLRVTFHRTLLIGREEVLQQCCEYDGIDLDDSASNAAGRTFEANHATIGAAYVGRQVLRTRAGAENETIGRDMEKLQLSDSAREMAPSVQSIAAIPVIGQTHQLTKEEPDESVIGVLYLDSGQKNYFSDEDRMTTLVNMTQQFATRLSSFANTAAGRIANNAFWRGATKIEPSRRVADPAALETLEAAPQPPPVARNLSQINFDLSDFEGAEG